MLFPFRRNRHSSQCIWHLPFSPVRVVVFIIYGYAPCSSTLAIVYSIIVANSTLVRVILIGEAGCIYYILGQHVAAVPRVEYIS